jgi:peroxiredoxin
MTHPRSTALLFLLGVSSVAACRSTGESADSPASSVVSPADAQRATTSPRTLEDATPAPVADGINRASLGELAPDFTLRDLDGREYRLSKYRGKLVVLEWFNPECHFVVHAYTEGPLHEMQERYSASGVVWLSINSSSTGQAGADPATNRAFAAEHRVRTPILFDPTGIVGRTYAARTTPHLFVINERGILVYRGALDNAPLGKVESTATKINYVEAAIADLKSGHAVTVSDVRPYGCGVRYGKP